jgi:hypothetical protein
LAVVYEHTKARKRRKKRKKKDGVWVYLCREQRNWTKAWIHGIVDVNAVTPLLIATYDMDLESLTLCNNPKI